jgi:hypothetical protein
MRDNEVAQDMRACADGSADAIKLSCEAPTIRELIEEQIARRASARHAEKLTATVNETVPISDNSPRRRGGAGRKRRGQPGQVDTTSLADMLCDAVGLKRDFPSLIPPRPYCADLAPSHRPAHGIRQTPAKATADAWDVASRCCMVRVLRCAPLGAARALAPITRHPFGVSPHALPN